MGPTRHETSQLLTYNPVWRVVICRECRYAVQKNALDSHLLRHKVYRGDRQRLLDAIATHDLVPVSDISQPPPWTPPIEGLDVIDGLRCSATGCDNLCASAKRMRRHWSEAHAQSAAPIDVASLARPVRLQTFFRGTQLRYFEVAATADHGIGTRHAGPSGSRNVAAPAAAQSQVASIPILPAPAVDLVPLLYFQHFTTVTSLTLPPFVPAADTEQLYWTTTVAAALQHEWLMCGLLATSAAHMAHLASTAPAKAPHIQQFQVYHSAFDAGRKSSGVDQAVHSGADNAQPERRHVESVMNVIALVRAGKARDLHERIDVCAVLSAVRALQPYSDAYPTRLSLVRRAESATRTQPSPRSLIDGLESLPARLAASLPRPSNDAEMCSILIVLAAIERLSECCRVAYEPIDVGGAAVAAWEGMAAWTAGVSTDFNGLVVRHHPAALTVTAVWAGLLVRRAEAMGCWFLSGVADAVSSEMLRLLPPDAAALRDLIQFFSDMHEPV